MTSYFSLILQPTLPYLQLPSYPNQDSTPTLQIWNDPRLMNKTASPFLRTVAPTHTVYEHMTALWPGLLAGSLTASYAVSLFLILSLGHIWILTLLPACCLVLMKPA